MDEKEDFIPKIVNTWQINSLFNFQSVITFIFKRNLDERKRNFDHHFKNSLHELQTRRDRLRHVTHEWDDNFLTLLATANRHVAKKSGQSRWSLSPFKTYAQAFVHISAKKGVGAPLYFKLEVKIQLYLTRVKQSFFF